MSSPAGYKRLIRLGFVVAISSCYLARENEVEHRWGIETTGMERQCPDYSWIVSSVTEIMSRVKVQYAVSDNLSFVCYVRYAEHSVFFHA